MYVFILSFLTFLFLNKTASKAALDPKDINYNSFQRGLLEGLGVF